MNDRSFTIAVVNVTDTQIVIKEGTQITTAENCERIKCTATLVVHVGNY